MIFCKVLVCSIGLVICAVSAPSFAQEERTYTYDALGRLIGQVSELGVNDGDARTYCFDEVGNRTRVISGESGVLGDCSSQSIGVACVLEAFDAQGSDEFSVFPGVLKDGACPFDIELSHSIRAVQRGGKYNVVGYRSESARNVSDNILGSGETIKFLHIDPELFGPSGPPRLVLEVTWSTATPGVVINPAVSTVTLYNSD